MKVAWLRPRQAEGAGGLDGSATLLDHLASACELECFDERTAHDLVWRHARDPFDLFVHELANTPAHQFVWAYVFPYPGVLFLRHASLHDARAQMLERQHRHADYAAEFAFDHPDKADSGHLHTRRGTWPMLRAPLVASRVSVVSSAALATSIGEAYPGTRVRSVPVTASDLFARIPSRPRPAVVTFGVAAGHDTASARRAIQRAVDTGSAAALIVRPSLEDVLRDADVLVALRTPFDELPFPAVAAMAASRPAIVLETEITSEWPALDPQTWQPRGYGERRPPVAVSVDPRDEEHSLMLAMRRLAGEPSLRDALAANAQEWWRRRATPSHAVEAWRRIITDAVALTPPLPPPSWPAHLTADGSETARALLAACGVSVDLF